MIPCVVCVSVNLLGTGHTEPKGSGASVLVNALALVLSWYFLKIIDEIPEKKDVGSPVATTSAPIGRG